MSTTHTNAANLSQPITGEASGETLFMVPATTDPAYVPLIEQTTGNLAHVALEAPSDRVAVNIDAAGIQGDQLAQHNEHKPFSQAGNLSRKPKRLVVAASTALTAFALAACAPSARVAGQDGMNDVAQIEHTETSSPTDIAQSDTPEVEDPSSSTPQATDEETGPTQTPSPSEGAPTSNETILTLTHTFEELQAMSVDEFVQLDMADRVGYLYMLSPNMPVSLQGEEIDPTLIPGYYWQTLQQEAVSRRDPNDAAKVMAAMPYYATTPSGEPIASLQSAMQQAMATSGPIGSLSSVLVYEDSGQWQQVKDRDGNTITTISITYNFEDRSPNDDIDITTETRTAQAIPVTIQLPDGRIIRPVLVGYGKEGRQAPDENYPY